MTDPNNEKSEKETSPRGASGRSAFRATKAHRSVDMTGALWVIDQAPLLSVLAMLYICVGSLIFKVGQPEYAQVALKLALALLMITAGPRILPVIRDRLVQRARQWDSERRSHGTGRA